MGVSPFLPELRENSAVSLRLALFLTFVGQNGAGCRAGHGSLQPVGPPARLRSMLGMLGLGVESGLMSGR